MSIWDKLSGGSRDRVGKYAWAIVVAVLKEAGEVALAEFAAALEQYRKERKTPDGWTEEEYLTYAIGRLRLIQAKSIGPWVVDEVIDYCIDRLIDVLEGKVEHVDDEPVDDDVDEPEAPVEPPVVAEPVEEPPAPTAPAVDPYFPTRYGPDDAIPYNRLKQGDKVYKDGLSRFVVPGLFDKFYVNVTSGATLIDVVEADGKDVVR